MQVKIATWNMQQSGRGCDYLATTIAPDIALVQEAVEPNRDVWKHGVWRNIKGRGCGSGIYTQEFVITERIIKNNLYPGSLIAAVAALPNNTLLTLISLYGLTVDTYSITTLHRMLSDLTPILDVSRKRLVIGGDFNASLQWDTRQDSKSHWLLFERLKDFGMVDCLEQCQKERFPIRTWRKPHNDSVPWQLDYLFASEGVANKLSFCDVLENSNICELSDHNPVVAVFDL